MVQAESYACYLGYDLISHLCPDLFLTQRRKKQQMEDEKRKSKGERGWLAVLSRIPVGLGRGSCDSIRGA